MFSCSLFFHHFCFFPSSFDSHKLFASDCVLWRSGPQSYPHKGKNEKRPKTNLRKKSHNKATRRKKKKWKTPPTLCCLFVLFWMLFLCFHFGLCLALAPRLGGRTSKTKKHKFIMKLYFMFIPRVIEIILLKEFFSFFPLNEERKVCQVSVYWHSALLTWAEKLIFYSSRKAELIAIEV